MVNKYSRSDGIALIGIIAAIVVAGILGAGVLMLVTTSSMESLRTLNWNRAFFAAEAGISRAKAYWYGSLPWTNTGWIGSAFFTNTITTNAATNIVVSSTGVQGDSRWTSLWRPIETQRGIIVYKEGNDNNPRYRTFSNRSLSDEFTAESVSTRIRWQRIEANPRTNEFLLVTEDNNKWVYAQTYVNGTWVSNTWLNSAGQVPNAAARGFDVAYENLSGRGLVVYSVGSPTPQYRTWTTNGWSAPGSITVGAANAIQWIRLVSKPGTDEIMCLARWDKNTGPGWSRGRYSSAIVWNGTSWFNLTNLEERSSASISYETMDAAYSTNSALVVYVNGPDLSQPKSRTYISGVWSTETTMGNLSTTPGWIRAEYSADGALAYAAFLQSGSQLSGTYWNGSAWGSYNNFGSLETTSYRAFDIAWSSQTNTLMVVYSPNANAQKYLLATGGGSSNQYGNLESTDDGQWCILKADPFTSDFYYLAQDDKQDVNFQRWNGTDWILFPEPEDDTRDNNFNFTDFSFRRDRAP